MSRTGPGWAILKFGGTSVASAGNWQTISNLLAERVAAGLRPFVVHSAIGATSDELEQLLELSLRGEHEEALESLIRLHLDLADALGMQGESVIGEHALELRQLLAGVRLVGYFGSDWSVEQGEFAWRD